MKLRWTRRASADLEQIGDHIAPDSAAAAAATVVRILDQAESLREHPHLGRAGRIAGTRELVIAETPFIVVYRANEAAIEVLAVFHGARRWPDSIA